MVYVIVCLVLALAGTFLFLAARAVRSEYLLVMQWRDGDIFVLERGPDGRYVLIPSVRFPLAVARYARSASSRALDTVPERVARKLPTGALPRAGRARAAHV